MEGHQQLSGDTRKQIPLKYEVAIDNARILALSVRSGVAVSPNKNEGTK